MTKDEKPQIASQCPICNRVVWETDVADCVATHEKPKTQSQPAPAPTESRS